MEHTKRAVVVAIAALIAFASIALAATYRGNTNTHVFHDSSCRYSTCKHCTVEFGSPEEAIARGYRPCGVCRPAGPSTAAAEVTSSYVGNTSSRKFHRASCRYASCKNCTAKFASRDEAIRAGYSPGGCCHP